jgi:acyl-CoA thioester hydrolase
MGAPFRHQLRVRFNECDPQGIVFNANYLVYFDVALTELFRAAMGSWHEMVRDGTDLVLVESRVTYRAPARSDELIEVVLAVGRFGTTSLRVDGRIERERRALAEGELHYVSVSAGDHVKLPVPDRVRAALAPYVT